MNAQTERLELAGEAGRIQALRDLPAGESIGVAIISHPNPLYGGTMDNKVVQTLARAFVQAGWTAVRFNFRGVGTSEGEHAKGDGETEDLLRVIDQIGADGPISLAGFSFGAYVTLRALQAAWGTRDIRRIVLVGTATSRFDCPALTQPAHEATLVIHGDEDDTVELSSVLDWARPQTLPVTVVPGVGHFFHGQLPLLKSLVLRHLR